MQLQVLTNCLYYNNICFYIENSYKYIALVKNICSSTPAATDSFETFLLPPFQQILQMDILEFAPYVFQILGGSFRYGIYIHRYDIYIYI
jgi:hypothetical protein